MPPMTGQDQVAFRSGGGDEAEPFAVAAVERGPGISAVASDFELVRTPARIHAVHRDTPIVPALIGRPEWLWSSKPCARMTRQTRL